MPSSTILALDASSEACSVGLVHEGEIFVRESLQPRTHAQVLLGLVDVCLNEAGIKLGDLSQIAVINGPGSFTGVRIAVSVAQGLAYGLGVPVQTMSSLDVMAHSTGRSLSSDAVIISAIDARMQEVYWSAYRLDKQQGTLAVLNEAAVSGYSEFVAGVKAIEPSDQLMVTEPVFAVGSAFDLDTLSAEALGLVRAQGSLDAESALAMLSDDRAATLLSAPLLDGKDLQPFYLRNEVAWKKRKRIRDNTAYPSM